MVSDDNQKLVRLSDTDQTVANENEDIRGRSVKDRSGEDIGKVDDLLIDPSEDKVRFLIVASGGLLGIGKDKAFILVDAVIEVGADEVHIDQTREHVAGAPAYDPEFINDRTYNESVFGYYGYAPYWSAGYAYPGYPNYVA